MGKLAEQLRSDAHGSRRLQGLGAALGAGEISLASATTIAKESDRLATFAPHIAEAAVTGLVDAAAAGHSRRDLVNAVDAVVTEFRSPASAAAETARRGRVLADSHTRAATSLRGHELARP